MASQFQSMKKWKYAAFLSFRREDFDGSFVTDLYKRLEDKGINAFKHDVKSDEGAPISTEISEAIEESKIAITIFSKKYASSRRCLEEITKIMDCVDNKGLESFSVFYRVDVYEILDTIDQVLDKHQTYLKGSDLKKVQTWKDALYKAFNIAGLSKTLNVNLAVMWRILGLIHGKDEEVIEEIVDKASQVMNIAKYPVAIRSRVEEVKSLLKVESGGVHSIRILGMAGVGKTTVARALFNEISCQFEV